MLELTSTQFTDWKVFRTQDENDQWILVIRGYWAAAPTVAVELVWDEGGIYNGSDPNALNLILQATTGKPSPELEFRTYAPNEAWNTVTINFPDGSSEYFPTPGYHPSPGNAR